jgi:hypothetical protein
MKISTAFLAAVLLGLATHLGLRGASSCNDEHATLVRDLRIGAVESLRLSLDSRPLSTPSDLKAYHALREREALVRKRIQEVESSLRKIENNERVLKRRLEEIDRERRRRSPALCDEEVSAMVRASEETLFKQFEALKEERAVFVGFLERFKNEQASLKVKIDLFEVTAKRSAMEAHFGEKSGPLDGLAEEARQRMRSKSKGFSIAY